VSLFPNKSPLGLNLEENFRAHTTEEFHWFSSALKMAMLELQAVEAKLGWTEGPRGRILKVQLIYNSSPRK